MVEQTNSSKKELQEGALVSTEQFQKQVQDAGTIEQIDYSKWKAEDCIVKDITLPPEARGQFARTIENLLTAEECRAMIASTEKMGYEEALVNVGYGM